MLHLRVYGYLWSGPRACHQYVIDRIPDNINDARRMAGDFKSLIDYHVCEETNEYESTGHGLLRRIDTFRTIRGWRNGMTNRRYDRAVNA